MTTRRQSNPADAELAELRPTDRDREVVASLPAPSPEAARQIVALLTAGVDKARAS